MKTLILSAGLGTRMNPLTEVLPKPLLPILNRPVLEHTLTMLKNNGICDVIVNLHHLSKKIVNHFGSGLNYSYEEKILGTAGAIKKCQDFFDDKTFLVINGDIISNIDLNKALVFHKEKRSPLTLIVREDDNLEKYKPIEIDQNGKIVRFPHSKLKNHIKGTTRVMFTGIQIVEPEIFEYIPKGQYCGTTDEIYLDILDEDSTIYGYLYKGYWRDIGNREDYILANDEALEGKIKLQGSGEWDPKGSNIMAPVLVGRNSILSPYSQVGPYVVLGENCRIDEGALIENSVCWNNVVISSGSIVRDSVLGSNMIVNPKQIISKRLGVQVGFKPTLSSPQ